VKLSANPVSAVYAVGLKGPLTRPGHTGYPLPRGEGTGFEGVQKLGARRCGMKAAHDFSAGSPYDAFLAICTAGDNRTIT
jgi:hypothetical protein